MHFEPASFKEFGQSAVFTADFKIKLNNRVETYLLIKFFTTKAKSKRDPLALVIPRHSNKGDIGFNITVPQY